MTAYGSDRHRAPAARIEFLRSGFANSTTVQGAPVRCSSRALYKRPSLHLPPLPFVLRRNPSTLTVSSPLGFQLRIYEEHAGDDGDDCRGHVRTRATE